MSVQLSVPVYGDAFDIDAVHRFTVEQYHQMIEAGVLTTDDKVELLRGLIVPMSPVGKYHRYVYQAILNELLRMLPNGWEPWGQCPITTEDSEPEPDIMVVRGTNADYKERHPSGPDVGLIVEVSDSSLSRDRGAKWSIYAADGVQQYWIVNIPDRRIETSTKPYAARGKKLAGYKTRRIYEEHEEIPVTLDAKRFGSFLVRDVLP